MISKNRRFEAIMAFAAAGLAGATLHDKLRDIHITSLWTAEHYLFAILFLLALCVWLIGVEYVLDALPWETTSVEKLIRLSVDFLFGFVICSPLIVLVIALITVITSSLGRPSPEQIKKSEDLVAIVAGILTAAFSLYATWRFAKQRRVMLNRELDAKQIISLELAEHLIRDGYPSQALLEVFKTIETHLTKLISAKGIELSGENFLQVLRIAMRYKLLEQKDIQEIDDIRKMRNAVAHQDITLSEDVARQALEYAKSLIRKSEPTPL